MITEREILAKVSIGMTREEVIALFGPPEKMGGTTRKYRTPAIYEYGKIEFHFAPGKRGGLQLVYTEDKKHEGRMLMVSDEVRAIEEAVRLKMAKS